MMKVALISMQSLNPEEAGALGFAPGGEKLWQKAELAQAVALALHMRDGGIFDPLLVCLKGGELERQAKSLALPFLAARNDGDLRALYRIWKWQRKEQEMLALANGTCSLAWAKKLLFMRKRKHVLFAPLFLLRGCRFSSSQLAFLQKAGVLVCGSDIIRKSFVEQFKGLKKCAEKHYIIHPAGLDLGQYNLAGESGGAEAEKRRQGRDHFAFCMAQSLAQQSGALLVVRAMSAIWQTENLPPWEVRMLGSGPRFEEIISEASSLGVLSRLSILGDQFPGQLASQCDVWLAPGTAQEELPETMGGAAAAGLPLVCSSSNLHRDWLAYLPLNVSLTVEKDNPQELARAMLSLMRDATLRASLGKASLEIRALVGLEEMATKICSAIENTVL